MRIRNKLISILLPLVSVVFISFVYITYTTTRPALERDIKARAVGMFDYYSLELNSQINEMESVALSLKTSLENVSLITEDDVKKLIQGFLKLNPDVYGSAVAFEPDAFSPDKALVGPYYYRAGDKLVYIDLSRSSYDYPKWDWYKIPIQAGSPLLSEPYLDVGGGSVTMITYSLPFYKNGKPWGVATVDIALSKLTKIIDDIGAGENGYAFLLNKNGTFLSMRRGGFKSLMTIFDASKEFANEDLNNLGIEMISGKNGFTYLNNPLDDKASWVAFGPISTTGWSLAIVLPQDELTMDLTKLNHRMILIFVLGIAAIFITIFKVSTRLTNPIVDLTIFAKKIASGDFAAKIKNTKSNDEVGVLTKAFAEFGDSVLASMERIAEEKEMFKVAFSQISDGIIIASPAWKILQYNKAAERFLSLPTNATLLDHLDSKFESSLPLIVLSNPYNEKKKFNLFRKEAESGTPEKLECSVTPILGENGQIQQFIITVRNKSPLTPL